MWGNSSQEPDTELGALSRDSELATLINGEDGFRVYRRFGALHARHCLQKQDELTHLEQRIHELGEGIDDELLQERYWKAASRTFPAQSMEAMENKISDFDTMISSMMSLTQTPTPSARHYQDVRDYLVRGPPISMGHSEIGGIRWAEYESIVKDLLMEPKIAPWLDGPVDQDWSGSLYQQLEVGEREETNDTIWRPRQMRRRNNVRTGGCVLFWISHVTAALGFILTSNTAEHNDYPIPEILLGYWYLSAVCIFVPEVISKGHLYARKVFLGGVATCSLGFYTLNVLLGSSTASAFTAIPTFFTIVLLLIRTM